MRGDNESETPEGVKIRGEMREGYESILTPEALELLADLHRHFDVERRRLLRVRRRRQERLDTGEAELRFRPETDVIRKADWTVPPAPKDLADRRVEITGPVDRKMIINALNSGANGFMADFEDATSPSWSNIMDGQVNLRDAVHRQIDFTDEASGKSYTLDKDPAVLHVRARGLHLDEAHLTVDRLPVAGAFFDFALFLFHNHKQLKKNKTGPYFYLPKLETADEARLWSLVIRHCEERLRIKRGTVRVTALIETLPATFELDEIIWALRENITALNAGRWDYIFSFIKRQKTDGSKVLPDRSAVTMATPFMAEYAKRVIAVCHRRGAHAMGGMSAFIPVKGDDAKNEAAMEKVKADKTREATIGHDGAWVAHPALVPIARAAFDKEMQGANQLSVIPEVAEEAAPYLTAAEGEITEDGQEMLLLEGGQGGLGNDHFKTSTFQTPRYAQPGEAGKEEWFILELKVLADVGLIGFPNAGKSTLLSVISAARPEIADYPFTTLTPNLGVVDYRQYQSFVMADIPGIIEGAAEGKGLGTRFLRHIERNAVLLFMIPADSQDIMQEYQTLLAELEHYNPEMLDKKRMMAITKSDLLDEELQQAIEEELSLDIPYTFISAATESGIIGLKDQLWQLIQ